MVTYGSGTGTEARASVGTATVSGSAELARVADNLTWTRSLDRSLVHRNAIAEVLLTDVLPASATDFAIAAQWPRAHLVYRPDAQGRHDPMLLLETIRQSGLAVSHVGFGVQRDQQSLMRCIGFTLDPIREPRAVTGATDLVVMLRCQNVVWRAGSLRSMTVRARFFAAGVCFATGTGMIGWLTPGSYAALRSRAGRRPVCLDPVAAEAQSTAPHTPLPHTPPAHTPPADAPPTDAPPTDAPPAATRLRRASDRLIDQDADGDARSRRLVVPVGHPVYFDHPLDHVPGMMLIDAAWQAAADRLGEDARLVAALMRCPTFTELDRPIHILLTEAPVADTVRFAIQQDSRETAYGTLQITR